METICSHYPDASEIEEESSWNGFDSILKFDANWKNSGQHSIAPLNTYASPESDGQQKTIHLIRYMVSLWANLIEGQNMKTIKKGNLEYVQPLSGERSF